MKAQEERLNKRSKTSLEGAFQTSHENKNDKQKVRNISDNNSAKGGNTTENQSSPKLKKIRSDRGTQHTSMQSNKIYEDDGVDHQLTVGYTSQQNGVSERKNRTMMKMAK